MAKPIVLFSGGKDSLACLLWTLENITKSPEIVFCDTGWESPLTYQHVNEVESKLGIPIRKLKSKKYNGMVELAKKKKRFPASKSRYCTEELKVVPFIDYLLDEVKDNVLIIQGIRAGESEARSNMNMNCTYFKYYFEPYTSNPIKLKQKENKLFKLRQENKKIPVNLLKDIEKLETLISNGVINEKYYSYRKKDIKKFVKQFADDVLRPVFEWTGQQTIDFALDRGFEPNKLYSLGFKRVGCFPCIMSGILEIYYISIHFPERIDEIRQYEKEVGSSFFKPGFIPKWACANGQYAFIDEIVKYVQDKYATGNLFQDENTETCMSYYGLCAN